MGGESPWLVPRLVPFALSRPSTLARRPSPAAGWPSGGCVGQPRARPRALCGAPRPKRGTLAAPPVGAALGRTLCASSVPPPACFEFGCVKALFSGAPHTPDPGLDG